MSDERFIAKIDKTLYIVDTEKNHKIRDTYKACEVLNQLNNEIILLKEQNMKGSTYCEKWVNHMKKTVKLLEDNVRDLEINILDLKKENKDLREINKENQLLHEENVKQCERWRSLYELKDAEVTARVDALNKVCEYYTSEVLFKSDTDPNQAVKEVINAILNAPSFSF